jgi:hypothetical protein
MAKKVRLTQDPTAGLWFAECEACFATFATTERSDASKKGHDHFRAEHSAEDINRSKRSVPWLH